MTNQHEEDDFESSQTIIYKPGEKKTLEDYQSLDSQDESLNRWKASLGLNRTNPSSNTDDPRNVVVESITLRIVDRPDVTVDLSTLQAVEEAKKKTLIIKEGIEYQMIIKFRVQHEVVSGLRYNQVVKRKGLKIDEINEMIGSYGPGVNSYEKKCELNEAPSGFLSRGTYHARSKFTDDDKGVHMEWEWSFKIAQDWEE